MFNSLIRVSLIVSVILLITFTGNAQEPTPLIQPIPGTVQRLASPEISWNVATNQLGYLPADVIAATEQPDTTGYISLWQPEMNPLTGAMTVDSNRVERFPTIRSSALGNKRTFRACHV
jgi:hypothetical protein